MVGAMTVALPSVSDGTAVGLMPTPLSPAAFAEAAEHIVATNGRDIAHRQMDELVMRQLTSLGFGEGVKIFERAVSEYHRA